MEKVTGHKLIKSLLKTMSNGPGVYRMLDFSGKILYVGKAKNLAQRLSNYLTSARLSTRILSMVNQTNSLEIITTKSEREAILLEANLIKNLQPKYNILLKDDKSFPYIAIRQDHEFAQIVKLRPKRNLSTQSTPPPKSVDKYSLNESDNNSFEYEKLNKYEKYKMFGPFASNKDVDSTINYLQQIFQLRSCSDSYFLSRTRPCLEYQIKRCSAPCVKKISLQDYQKSVREAYDFLMGKSKQLIIDLTKQMESASTNQLYEQAAKIRDRIKMLNIIQARRNIVAEIQDADVIAIESDSNEYCLQIFFFRAGQSYGNKSFFFKYTDDNQQNEILRSFIIQFYQEVSAPKLLIVSNELDDQKSIELMLKTKIIIPKIGNKLTLLNLALDNAKNSLQRRSAQISKNQQALQDVADLFDLQNAPQRIDVFDNSHISGTNAIGAMIVADQQGLNKKAYRMFNITKTSIPDDYAMLKEVLTRRYSRLKKEYPNYIAGIWPDLVLIDGGEGHLSTAQKVVKELGLDLKLVCIAKGPERNAGKEEFYQEGKNKFTLDKNLPVMKYLQILRDEAHRFAITSHRKKRTKSMSSSILNEIPGIGAKRKMSLLTHFGSVQDLKSASLEDIMKVPMINRKTAETIFNFFNHQN